MANKNRYYVINNIKQGGFDVVDRKTGEIMLITQSEPVAIAKAAELNELEAIY